MTEVKKFTWSGVILAIAFVAGLAFLSSPASALDNLFFFGPDEIHVGDTITVNAEADDYGDDGHALFTITQSGPGGGAAVFTANGLDTLTCSNDQDDNDDFPFIICDHDMSDDIIEVEIIGTEPGVVLVCAEGFTGENGLSNQGDPTDGDQPRCLQLTIEGSGGGILTITSNKDSIGRPNEVGGWTGPGSPFDEFVLTAHLTLENGTPIPGQDVDFNTISPPAPNNLMLRDDEFDLYSHGGASCVTGANGRCTVEGISTNSSEYGLHTIIGVVDGGVDAAGAVGIIVAKPPSIVVWELDDPQGAATSQNVLIHVTDVDGRPGWTGLGVGTDAGDGAFGTLLCSVPSIRMGMADCTYLSSGMTGEAILAVLIGGGLYSEYVLTIVPGGTPPSGTFNPVPVAGGLTITTYTGTLAALVADGAALNLVSCFATVGGNFIGHIFGAPAFVNSAFDTHFAGGFDEQGLICRRA